MSYVTWRIGAPAATWRRVDFAATVAALGFLAIVLAVSHQIGPLSAPLTKQRAGATHAKLPLSFVPNRGQTDRSVRYYAEGKGFGFYFTDRKAVLAFNKGGHGAALQLRFLGASPAATLHAERARGGRVNYVTGHDPARWQTGLPTYGQLAYQRLWPGIDMRFRGTGTQLKYEFLLSPGANAERIRLAYAGADGLSLSRSGDLLVRTPVGTIRDAKPRAWQQIGGRRVPVESRYSLAPATAGAPAYGVELGAHDAGSPVVIDPGLVYSTFLGGSSTDLGDAIAVDADDNAYVTGRTDSAGFPTAPGAFDTTLGASSDAFVTKLDSSGALSYSTFLGGSGLEEGYSIAVDSAGDAYVAGYTSSSDFPTTAGALDTTHNGADDVFVTKLSPSGSSLVYSTLMGGSNSEYANDVAIDGSGAAYLTGYAISSNFPTTAGAFDTTFGGFYDAFAAKLNASGSSLAYSTYLGGSDSDSGNAIAVDSAGNAYVGGGTRSAGFPTVAGGYDTTHNGIDDAFITKLNASGSSLSYSTFVGSTGTEGVSAIALDSTGSAYITGFTDSTGFPTTPGAYDTSYNGDGDAFVAKLNGAGSGLNYSTFLGGPGTQTTGYDAGLGIAVNPAGNAYVTGRTDSVLFPTTTGAYDTVNGGVGDVFVAQFNAAGSSLAYSTFIGSTGTDVGQGIALGKADGVYVTGYTTSSDYPTTEGAADTTANGTYDVFVTKLDAVYTAPVGASPIRLSLVPAFEPCEVPDADSRHGEPLPFSSCNPPVPRSSTAIFGSKSIGFANVLVCNVGATPPNCSQSGLVEPDVRLFANLRDVKCRTSVPAGCAPGDDYDPDSGAGPYTSTCTTAADCNSNGKAAPYCAESGTSQTGCIAGADLTWTAKIPGASTGAVGTQFEGSGVRITDSYNGPTQNAGATVVDIGYPIPMDCLPNNGSLGSTCGVNTSVNALTPGVVRTGARAIWQLGEMQVLDSGPDGIRGNTDDEVLAVQGIYVP
jgi:hypothetical protein